MKLYAPDPQLELRPDGIAVLLFPRRDEADRIRPNRSKRWHVRQIDIKPSRTFQPAPGSPLHHRSSSSRRGLPRHMPPWSAAST